MNDSVDDAARRMSELAGAGRTVTPVEIEARCGMPVSSVQELMRGFGVAVAEPDQPAFTPDEADALVRLWESEVWPFELAIQLSRMYGRLLARIAHATMQLWATVAEPRLVANMGGAEARQVGVDAFEQLLPVADSLLAGVHRRWLAREAAQLAFRRDPEASPGRARSRCRSCSAT